MKEDFYPRSPCGERRFLSPLDTGPRLFLSTLSLRRATLQPRSDRSSRNISIHALLAESDCFAVVIASPTPWAFLSTLSLRRATRQRLVGVRVGQDFYPRSPCGERLDQPQ